MSYDLYVYCPGTISPERLEGVLAAAVADAEEVAESSVHGDDVPQFTVDGPDRQERKDLPGDVAARMTGPTISVQLSAGYFDRASIDLARRAAQTVATTVGGVVYDPQDDTIVWPRP